VRHGGHFTKARRKNLLRVSAFDWKSLGLAMKAKFAKRSA
jgi:hypothetical protein